MIVLLILIMLNVEAIIKSLGGVKAQNSDILQLLVLKKKK